MLAVVHPTYALFLWLPFAGFLAVRWLWTRGTRARIGLALAALVVPAGLFFALAAARRAATPPRTRRAPARCARGLAPVPRPARRPRRTSLYSLAPEVLGRSGAVAVAALLLVPLAGLASPTALGRVRRRRLARRARRSASSPWLFTPFSDAVSLSQSRRAAGFLPFAFAFAGGLGRAPRDCSGAGSLPLAFAAGIVLQLAYPGDFDYRLTDGGPAARDLDRGARRRWSALVVGLVWRDVVARARRRGSRRRCSCCPSPCTALWNWSPSEARHAEPADARSRRGRCATTSRRGRVVYSDPETSYRIAAAAPVYIAVAPPGHVADTKENRPYERRDDARALPAHRRPRDPAPLRRGLARGRPRRSDLRPALPVVYRDGRYTLYRLG